MTHTLDVQLLVGTVGSLLYLLLGLWVLTLRPRSRQTMLLGAFALLVGIGFTLADTLFLLDVLRRGTVEGAVFGPFLTVAFVLALELARTVGGGLADRRLVGVSAGFGFGFAGVMTAASLANTAPSGLLPALDIVWPFGVLGLAWATALVLPLRAHPSQDPTEAEVQMLAILGVGLALFWVFFSGAAVTVTARALGAGEITEAIAQAMFASPWLVVAGAWARNMLDATGRSVGVHRTALLAILALLLAGSVHEVAALGASPAFGILRTLGVGLLAYGILRHDLAGLDAKVEWTVSKTTVAGVFVAVFFVVSEGAQVLFADFAQNEILGVIAAGALLFALAPIQRLADRIAERAVPSGAGDEEETYRITAAKYLADGTLSAEEERHLARLADRLGIDAERAVELRQEVAGGTDAGGEA